MEKISKVKSVQGNGVYENANGVDVGGGKKGYFKHEYTFEDGTTLVANHTTQMPFPVGTEVAYEVKGTNNYGSWGKVAKPKENGQQNQSTPKTPEEKSAVQKAIIYQSAFKEAVGFHNINRFTNSGNAFNELCSTADAIAQYVIKKSGI